MGRLQAKQPVRSKYRQVPVSFFVKYVAEVLANEEDRKNFMFEVTRVDPAENGDMIVVTVSTGEKFTLTVESHP